MNLSKRQPPSTSLLTLCFFFSNNFFFPRKLSDIEQKMVKNQFRANKMFVIADMLWARHDYPLYYFSMKCVIHILSWKTTCCRLKWFFQWNLIIFKNSCLQILFSHEISLFRTFLTILFKLWPILFEQPPASCIVTRYRVCKVGRWTEIPWSKQRVNYWNKNHDELEKRTEVCMICK